MDSPIPVEDTEYVWEGLDLTGKCVMQAMKDLIRCVFIPKGCKVIPENCFCECDVLSRVTFARGSVLKRIGDQAFMNCLSLREIEIPASVEEIGVGCFMRKLYITHTDNGKTDPYSRSRLSRVTFASGSILKRIERDAFSSCDSLEEIEIPASVEEIGEQCFCSCSSLTCVTFASGSALKSIGEAAFHTCMRLLEIRIPATVEFIGPQCFKCLPEGRKCCCLRYVEFECGSMLKLVSSGSFLYCKELGEIIIPENVESLDGTCFGDCVSLTKVILNSKLKSIGSGAFERCVRLKCIDIPASVEQLAGFNGCISLSEVRFASDSCLKSIGSRAFCACCSLSRIEIPASVETLGDECFAYEDDLWIRGRPQLLSQVVFAPGSQLKSIGQSAFSHCAKIEEIDIPVGVEILGKMCFCGCESLTVVTFGGESCLKHIGQSAFSGCTRIREIEIPAGVRVLPPSCFGITKERNPSLDLDGCASLARVTFPNESVLECITEDAFSGCKSLVSIDIPSSVTQIAVSAFRESGVVNINIEGNRVYSNIGDFIMKSDTLVMMAHPVSDLTIPANIEVLDDNCFANGEIIQSLKFESGSRLRHIARRVFSWCSNLSEIEIPANLEVLGDRCFYLCMGIKYVTFEKGTRLKRIGKETFAGCVKLSHIEIPASVEVIDERCFCYVDCNDSESVDPSYVFACGSLCSVTFEAGSRLKRIEDRAFASSGIAEIVIPASVEYIGVKCFGFNNDPVDSGCVRMYVEDMPRCGLKRIEFEAGSRLKTIGDSAFLGSYLTEIEVPASVEYLGDSLFGGYWDVVVRYGIDYFAGNVEHVTFQSGSHLKVLGGVFKGCEKLTEIEIPASVEEIGCECFGNIYWLDGVGGEQQITCGIKKVTFEEGSRLKYIHSRAFQGCVDLKDIEIPASVRYIGHNCFGTGRRDIWRAEPSLACNVTEFRISPENKFYEVDGPFIIRSDSKTLVDCFRQLTEVEIPAQVEIIGEYCFWGSAIESVTFASGSRLKYIEKFAFKACEYLEPPVLPPGVIDMNQKFETSTKQPVSSGSHSPANPQDDNKQRLETIGPFTVAVDTNTLVRCSKDIKDIVIPSNIEVIATDALTTNGQVESITFESGSHLKRIDYGAIMQDGDRVIKIELPASVEEIDPGAFVGCLCTINISPENQIFESDGPFILRKASSTAVCFTYMDLAGKDVRIPGYIEVIGPMCFKNMDYSIKKVRFAQDSCLKRIGEEAFCHSNRHLGIEIPASVEEIGDRCFSYYERYWDDDHCSLEIKFAPNSNLKYIGKGAFENSNLKYIRIPARVEVIDDECFSNCRKLRCVVFESGSCLKRLGKKAFQNCISLREIEIPGSIEEIGDDCFGEALPYVRFESGTPLKQGPEAS